MHTKSQCIIASRIHSGTGRILRIDIRVHELPIGIQYLSRFVLAQVVITKPTRHKHRVTGEVIAAGQNAIRSNKHKIIRPVTVPVIIIAAWVIMEKTVINDRLRIRISFIDRNIIIITKDTVRNLRRGSAGTEHSSAQSVE